MPTTLTVTSAADDGSVGTLRWAIATLNQMPGAADRINFDITGSSPQTITLSPLLGGLPAITDPMVINATTQPGFNNGVPAIILDGSQTGAGAGFDVLAGNTTIEGLDIQRFSSGSGILLEGGGSDVIQDNYIGIDQDGHTPRANTYGIDITSGSGDIIGGTLPHEGNVLTGNSFYGLLVASNDNLIEGNYIGTDAAGTMAVGNDFEGMAVTAPSNTIGGTIMGAGNLIAGNFGAGLDISSDLNLVLGNFIGTDLNGTLSVGNAGDGVTISGNNNSIGGTATADRNVISGNFFNGLSVFSGQGNVLEGNYIGTDKTGTVALGNAVGVSLFAASNTLIGGTGVGDRNLISGNTGAGLEILGGDGTLVQGNYIGIDPTGAAGLANGSSGVLVASSSTNALIGGTMAGSRNIISGNLGSGILITGSGTTGTLVQGNFIGTDVTGTMALGNQLDGVTIYDEAFNNIIGGTINGMNTSARNLISGNVGSGVNIYHEPTTSGNQVIGNYIGTDVSGTVALANGFGVTIADGASGNTIGGYPDLPNNGDRYGNLLSGNVNYGLGIGGPGTAANMVLGNFIGTDPTGKTAVPNSDGVALFDGAGGTVAASGNIIGGYALTVNNTDYLPTNVISGNTNDGVHIYDSHTTNNQIQSNYIGTDLTGTVALANNYGVEISDGATGNLIGGYPDMTMQRHPATNVIAGNTSDGVHIIDSRTSGNVFIDNFIGLDKTGRTVLANGGSGVSISYQATGNMIGEGFDDRNLSGGNIIAGNAGDGISIFREATSNVILGNQIGSISANNPMDPFQRIPLPNGLAGIHIYDTGSIGNTIGSTDAGAGNLITDNTNDAILVDSSTGDSIRANSIYNTSAGNLGIDLMNGGNHNQPAPVNFSGTWNSATQTLTVMGDFAGTPGTTYYLDFFANATPNPVGFGDGRQYLGTVTVLIDATGDVPFMQDLTGIMPDITGQLLTATATATIILPNGMLKETDTSEFSAPVAIVGAFIGPVREPLGQPVAVSGVAATVTGLPSLSPVIVQPALSAAAPGQGLPVSPPSLDSVFARYEQLSQHRGPVEDLLAELSPSWSGTL